jgi:predicted nucleotidyltransferase
MNIQDLKDKGLIIFEAIGGSRAYGTDLPTSDTDIRGVFILPKDDIMGSKYVEQVNDKKNDIVYYEIRRFIELISTANPNILELLNTPEECILYKDPVFDILLAEKDIFVTKQCRNSFGGYATTQIKKARGMKKKIVNPVDKIKKSILDFCYIIDMKGNGVTRLTSDPILIESITYNRKHYGASSIPHAQDMYYIFHHERPIYHGLVNEDQTSNQLRLTSIPKGQKPAAIMSYNKDGYTAYCKDYKEYWEWVENRNPERYENNQQHGKGYDSKNLMHCHRLLDMCLEILDGQGIIVRRPNREELLEIRRGEKDYTELLDDAEAKLKTMDALFIKSDLPSNVDWSITNRMLIEMRNAFYLKKQIKLKYHTPVDNPIDMGDVSEY